VVVAVVFNLLEVVKYYYDTNLVLVGTKDPETGFSVV
jgi:hypothetical protein